MDGGARQAAVHGTAKSLTQLSNVTDYSDTQFVAVPNSQANVLSEISTTALSGTETGEDGTVWAAEGTTIQSSRQ